MFELKDEAIHFPASRLPDAGARTTHPFRRVIVAQSLIACAREIPISILVVPCSAHSRGAVDTYDLRIPAGTGGFTGDKVVAYVTLTQPALKSDLARHCGQLTDDLLAEMQQRLRALFGLDSRLLPPTL